MATTTFDIPGFMGKAERRIPDVMEIVGAFVEGEAIVRVPVDTGYLRGSISHKVIDGSIARVGSPVEYAPFIELGTVKMQAQPYLQPAVLDNRDKIVKLVQENL